MTHFNRSQSDIDAIFNSVHPDYRGSCKRVKKLMYLCPDTGATVLGPIANMPDSVYLDYLQSSRRKQTNPG